ncbi:sodium pump decarboxylase subunit gamma [Aliikangiella marina]|uniref:Oxaloacetate decarboxylase gamma chain n=1 Tax=Aliikangiella marina TaxID=1712262 RepID=A0A545TID7_9GAMM|nr:OadG family transporter subunit [Aliikangiella marina]TQV76984.1 sodium pump decarboxylase subunit gamma [Aliikangiella marina]
MTESSLLSEGLILMLTGMGMVFVFLSILVFFTSLLYRFFGEEPTTDKSRARTESSDDEIAAASAAVYAYRKKHSKK